jgi:cell division protein FtsN
MYNNQKYQVMKKIMFVCAAMCVALAFTSCKSNESAYRKAYEKAKAQDQTAQAVEAQAPVEETVVAPVETRPATETRVVDNVDNVSVRQESVSLVNGTGLKNFSVVVGSFSVKANAEGLQQTLKNAGYDAQIAFSSARSMYRVIASTYNDKESAVRSRNDLRSKYADAWLLYNQQ